MVKRTIYKILLSAIGLILVAGISYVGFMYVKYGAPLKYSAEAIEAWVVDAGTKKPVKGVIVVAHWQLLSGWEGHYPMGQMMVMETVTDKTGRFYFPPWGPKWHLGSGILKERDPQLLLFKPGYRPRTLTNQYNFSDEMYTKSLRTSQWHGKTIELEPFEGGLEEYMKHLSSLNTSLRTVVGYDSECQWRKMPKMLSAIFQQDQIFRDKGIDSWLMQVESLPEAKCGSPKEYFKEMQK